jgi:hypothetical protein
MVLSVQCRISGGLVAIVRNPLDGGKKILKEKVKGQQKWRGACVVS